MRQRVSLKRTVRGENMANLLKY